MPVDPHSGFSRRGVLTAGSVSVAGLSLSAAKAVDVSPISAPRDLAQIDLTVNGAPQRLSVDPRTTLLDALREHLSLTGSKKGCDHGQAAPALCVSAIEPPSPA